MKMSGSKLKFWPLHVKIDYVRYNTNTGYIPWWNHFEIKRLYGATSCAPIYEFKHLTGHNQDQSGKKKFIGWIIIDQCRFLSAKEKQTAKNVIRTCVYIKNTDILFNLVNAWKNMTVETDASLLAINREVISRYSFLLYNKTVFWF